MIFELTYQQDSLKESIPLKGISQIPESGGLEINHSSASPEDVSVGENLRIKSDRIVSSIKNKNLHRKQNLLAGKSKFIEPRNEIRLVTVVAVNEDLHLPERPFNRINYDWITLLLLVALALFASVRITWNKYMINLFQSTVNNSTSIRMFQEKNNSLLQGAFQLDVLFYLIFSVFIFQAMEFFRIDFPYPHLYTYLFCLLLVVSYFLLKKLIYHFIGVLIEKKGETGEFLFNLDNFKRVTGLFLLPVVAIIAFYPFSQENIPLLIGVAVIVFLYSLLIFRGFAILLRKQFSIFYLFLYFCTLEFLPLVLLYKILVV